MFIPICETFQDFLSDGEKLHTKGVFGQPFEGPIFSILVHWLSNPPYYCKGTSQESINLERKVLLGLFLGYALYACGIWKGDMMVADIEELEAMDASEIYSKRTQCKGSNISQRKWKNSFSSRRWDESNLQEEIRN